MFSSPSLPIKRREVSRWHGGVERGIKVLPNGVKAPVMLTLLVGSPQTETLHQLMLL